MKKNKTQLCLQWAPSLTEPRKSSEKFRFISILSGHLQLLYLSELQSHNGHTADKGTKGKSHLASVLGTLQFCGPRTMSQRGAATPSTSGELAALRPPCWCPPLGPSDSRPGTRPGRGDRITQNSLTVTTRTFRCCHHPRTSVLG